MSAPAKGEIAILVDQVMAAEAALTDARHEAAAVKHRLRQGESLLAASLLALARTAIAAAGPESTAPAAAPTVSVIMPVRDRAHIVGDAIRSVLAQTLRDWELIVVDDGSRDGIEDALARFRADPRLRVLRQPAAGVCAARNRGLGAARAPLVAYLDSDNFWFPGFLAAAAEAFAADPEIDVLYGGLVRETDAGLRLWFEPFDRDRLLVANTVDLNAVVHRRALADHHGAFDERLTRAVDLDLVLRFTAEKPAHPLPVAAACYRAHNGPRISRDVPLAPNLFAIRRKWRPAPRIRPRVLYAVQTYPQLSESYIEDEMACMQRFGADIAVWALHAGFSPEAPRHEAFRGPLEAAIAAFRPDILHVHWLTVLRKQSAVLAAAGVPVTARAHSFDSAAGAIQQTLGLPSLARLYLLPASAARVTTLDPRAVTIQPAFDSTLFAPADKDPRLVLRTMAGLPQNDPKFLIDLALRLPNHRVVLAIARAVGFDQVPGELRDYAASIGSPIAFANDLPRREIAALIARAGIFLHTHPARDARLNKLVGGPVSIAEAMATGAYIVARDLPGLVDYVGDAGETYADIDHAAALIRATESWSPAQWQAARLRSIERAFTHHADEVALAPIFEDWCELVRQRDAARATPAAAS